MKAIKAKTTSKPKLLPINKILLMNIVQAVNRLDWADKLLFNTIILITYYGCFRIGEVVKSQTLKHTIHLEHLRIIRSKGMWSLKINLPTFKHSQEPATLIIPQANSGPCPVKHMLEYLKVRGSSPGPVFLHTNGNVVERGYVAKSLKLALKLVGKNPDLYNNHSLRIGRASDLASWGIPDHVIRKTGRWSSDAYLKYIRFADFKVPNL